MDNTVRPHITLNFLNKENVGTLSKEIKEANKNLKSSYSNLNQNKNRKFKNEELNKSLENNVDSLNVYQNSGTILNKSTGRSRLKQNQMNILKSKSSKILDEVTRSEIESFKNKSKEILTNLTLIENDMSNKDKLNQFDQHKNYLDSLKEEQSPSPIKDNKNKNSDENSTSPVIMRYKNYSGTICKNINSPKHRKSIESDQNSLQSHINANKDIANYVADENLKKNGIKLKE